MTRSFDSPYASGTRGLATPNDGGGYQRGSSDGRVIFFPVVGRGACAGPALIPMTTAYLRPVGPFPAALLTDGAHS